MDVGKTVENVKKRTYSFKGHLITPAFNRRLPKVSTSKSPTETLCSEMRTQETMELRTWCDKRPLSPHNVMYVFTVAALRRNKL